MSNFVVSVIVTTKNEENNIENCLRAINSQTYPKDKIEIIVVDNSSIDRTPSLAKKYTKNVFTKGPERSAQRNFGISKAHGKFVMYLDADMTLSPAVIEDCVSIYAKDTGVSGIYIREIVGGESYWSKVRCFERSFYDGTVIDCIRFFKKKDFNKVGGFDDTMTGPEDWDFDKKIRRLGKTVVVLTPLYHNEKEFNINKYLAKKSYYARSFDAYINKWGKNDPDIKKQFGFWYRYFGVFLENGKWKKCLFNPHFFLGMFLLRFLVGISFILRKKA